MSDEKNIENLEENASGADDNLTDENLSVNNNESNPKEIASEEEKNGDKPANVSPEQDKKYKWYCLRCYTGHEQKVKLLIESELKRLGMDQKVKEIIIPQETVFEVRGGKRKTKIKNFLPGYIVMNVDLDKKTKDVIQNLPSVVSFVGTKTQPAPLRKDEVDRIIGRVEERKSIATIATAFEIGDPVKVIDGPFSSFNGTVIEVNIEKQKLKVEVGILGRKTPVELDFSQVEMEKH